MKLFSALLVAPLVVPAVYLAGGFLLAGTVSVQELRENTVGFLFIIGPYAYLVALVLGIPGYFFLRSKGWLTLPILACIGTGLGVLTPIIFGIGSWAAMTILGALAGMLSLSCFWFIACRQPKKARHLTVKSDS